MAADGRDPSDFLIGLQLLAATLLGMWLGFDFASDLGGGFLRSTAGLIGGALIGLGLGVPLAALIPLTPELLSFANRTLWLFVLRAISRANDLPNFLCRHAGRIALRRRAIALYAVVVPAAAVDTEPVMEGDAWPDDDADDDGDEFWHDYVPVLPPEEKWTVNPNHLPRRMTLLSRVAAGTAGGIATFWMGAQGGTMGAVALAGGFGLVLGQFLPAVLNYLLGLAVALIQLAGEAILFAVMQLSRPLPIALRRMVAAVALGWDRYSWPLLVDWPYRLDVWLWGDKPFRAG